MYKAIINGQEYEVELKGDSNFVNGKEFVADMVEIKKGLFHVIHNLKSYNVEIVEVNLEEKIVALKINTNTYKVVIKTRYEELLEKIGMSQKQTQVGVEVKAPMPGLILNIMAEEGQEIKKGDALVTMEAMKMENIIKAIADGVVNKILVKKGDKVEKNQVMIRLG